MLVVVAYYSVDMVTDCTVHQEHVGTLKLCLYGAVAKLYTVWCRFKTLTLCSFLETGSTQYQVSVVLQTCANLWLRSPGLPGGPLLYQPWLPLQPKGGNKEAFLQTRCYLSQARADRMSPRTLIHVWGRNNVMTPKQKTEFCAGFAGSSIVTTCCYQLHSLSYFV